ncbi:MAG: M15 family metallopeptidase [Candidatus Nealsonbacteria bacterium]|nr:M15 family metallopeptidase [Candidatus Nealsonbacteria bacterium]
MWYSYLMKKNDNKLNLFLFALVIINLGIIGYLGYQNYQLKKDKLTLESEISQTKENFFSTTKSFQEVIDSVEWELAKTETERDDFELQYTMEKNRMDFLASQISGIQGTVGTLEKLSKTDPELLKKYSKVYFLSENYIPETFIKIETGYTYDSQEDYLIYAKIWQFLQDLLVTAKNGNIDIKVISAYRSFDAQSDLKSSYKIIYGSGANKFSADQGYSEHQLGTTIDFTTSEIGASYSDFEKTSTYQWLLENAYKYGFVLSYPENNKYYQFEPWHWRFVGRALAEKLHQDGKNFYDLDQREIDQYLISFFD